MAFAHEVGYIPHRYAKDMIDYMIATALILLIGGHALLIRGCFKINETLPTESGFITTEIRQVSSVLDEVADLLNELLNGGGSLSPAPAHTPTDIPSLLTAFLMNKTGIGANHGYPKEQNEWEVLQADENPQTQEATD